MAQTDINISPWTDPVLKLHQTQDFHRHFAGVTGVREAVLQFFHNYQLFTQIMLSMRDSCFLVKLHEEVTAGVRLDRLISWDVPSVSEFGSQRSSKLQITALFPREQIEGDINWDYGGQISSWSKSMHSVLFDI